MDINIIVMVVYFVLMIAISYAFKKMGTGSASHYFRGGGRMLWWMVGATAFMAQFSAWTFTGAAGQAYRYGFTAIGVFAGNVIGYIVGWWWFATRFRQLRVDTPTQAISQRFGPKNEQFFTWILIPLSILNAGVWLNSLAVFASAVFKYDLTLTLWITGLVVLLISLLSGSWGVVASDFVQTLIVAIISVVCAAVALFKVGGPVKMVNDFPSGFFTGPDTGPHYILILIVCFAFFFVKQLQSFNNLQDSYRYLNAKDSANAKKAALFALFLMLFGTLIWFIPPWATAILYPDMAQSHPELGKNATDAAYLVFAERAMPEGTVGLLMAGLFAATMSSMDTALNRNSGIFVRSFWTPVVNRNEPKSEHYLLRVGQTACIVNGVLVILVAQYMQSLQELSLFDLMIQVGTLASAPIIVPLFFGMFIRKTPDWSAWGTVVFGLIVSYVITHWITVKDVSDALGLTLTNRELKDLSAVWNIFCHLVFTGGFFCLSTLFYREPGKARASVLATFFSNMETPVYADHEQDGFDRLQRSKIGKISLAMGLCMLLMILIPNPLWGRLLFLLSAAAIILFGYVLWRSASSDSSTQGSNYVYRPEK
ncbi:TPA: transporter [Kluyvera ascorbata]|uniref:sodium:solute symporter family transporter n=1 Tax=Kluyvera TaxID=579 RepID=UPI0013D517D7|nr:MULTISPECIES: transporter [unclassified Kluyvera]MDA8488167.1 transporter [Kluyvera sp. Awk 3]UAK18469.1 transporter [Kluyvera sp. CRP]HDT6547251.1 transporter [Kluyvera ascorbata]